ncbi:site-specific integrase [Acrocarpospora macrocephala]|uniref:Putative integrase/recombinase y4rA n=1 Tax=Acrocarpospora macrocephala TaxID=150177 RepID=A0A5M3X9Z1_9ACTN|nr:site-specific integrase [Acrocarpospora macrocephala]GES17009.1 putative integrase/recombinase y4rA [Acrocarpospora macrocephala]
MAGTRRKPGLLGPHVEGYRAWLTERGYTFPTARNMLKDLGHVGRWLLSEGLEPAHLNEEQIEAFLAARRAAGQRRVPGLRGMMPLLTYLRETGVVPQCPHLTPLDVLLDQFRCWMIEERGLAPTTVLRYENTARRFLHEQAMAAEVFAPAALTGADINAFLLRECGRVSWGSAKGRVAELRSLLRFLYLQGITTSPLGAAVPPVGGWRFAALPPPAMASQEVQRLLDGCDRGTDVGVRDFAIIMLVARLGLRSIEVARLELGDVDWRAGELIVRGKAGRLDRLPLPSPVGDALVAYLSGERGREHDRHVFLTCRAPRRPVRADLVGDVVERACLRVGLARVGPHRLRHTLARQLLRHGADLVMISQILRHQDLATTALYAKVDFATLRLVAQPWPGAER